MITHSAFLALRLAEFCASDPLYTDDADEHGDLFIESIRGIDFRRHCEVESGTLIVDIDLINFSTDVGPAILSRIGLPVTRRSTVADVIGLLGEPASSEIDPDRGYDYLRVERYEFTVPDPDGYEVSCTWLHPGSVGRHQALRTAEMLLWGVQIRRSDLKKFPWSI